MDDPYGDHGVSEQSVGGTKGTPAGRINGRQRWSSHILSMPGRAGPDRK